MVFGCADVLVVGGKGAFLPHKSKIDYEKDIECKK